MNEIVLGEGKNQITTCDWKDCKCLLLIEGGGTGKPGELTGNHSVGDEFYPEKHKGTVVRFKSDDAICQLMRVLQEALTPSAEKE